MKGALLIINPKYSESVPPLTTKTYDQMKQSIKSEGQYHPIIVSKNLVILDGHHRYKICLELGIEPKYEIMEFPTSAHEQLFVIDSNLQRRELTPYVRCILALNSKPILEEIAKQRMLSGKKIKINPSETFNEGKGRVDEQIGQMTGLSYGTIRKVEFIEQKAPEEVKQRLREDKISISNVYSSILRHEKIQKAKADALSNSPKFIKPNSKFDLKLGDMRDKGVEVADNSIDLIFTDPLYNNESVPLYGDLAKLTQTVLKPGGSLVTFFGQGTLPEIMDLIKNNSDLQYHWLLVVKHNGNTDKMWLKRIWPKFKPLLWYFKSKENKNEKGPTMYTDIGDFIESEPPKKELHELEQSVPEVLHFLKPLTVENQIVLDPLMGSGTTGIAALNHNRKFIGIEIDKDNFEIAKHRISKIESQK